MSYCVLVALLVSMATSSYAVGVGGQCDASANCIRTNTQSSCQRSFTSASCTKGYCYCNTGYAGNTCMAETKIKLYGQSCTQNSDCGTGTCTSSACACAISTYTYRSAIARCLDPEMKVYGESCTQSTQCNNKFAGDTTGMTCSTTCQCDTGYVHRSGFCHIPYLGEACAASTGCTTKPLFIDASRQNETCNSGTCSCPSSTDQYTISVGGTSLSYCLNTTSVTLKLDGTTCALHNECASKFCTVCPADDTSTKRCLRLISDTSGVSGIQATTVVLLTLVALKVTLI